MGDSVNIQIMDDRDFIIYWFRHYYRECPPPPPPRFGKREFGFMFFDRGFVQRHLSFAKISDLHEFLIKNVPAHAYYSSAYYETPGAPTMDEKGWRGADLIFDLDADHIRGAEDLTFEEMLDLVKRETVRVVEDFLVRDFGFGEEEIHVVFSGGRGFHIHVPSDAVTALKSHERREIVDYITGTDLDMDWVFEETGRYEKVFGKKRIVNRVRLVPAPEAGGWRRRMRVALVALLDELEGMEPEEARKRFPCLREVSDSLVESLLKTVGEGGVGSLKESILTKGNLEDLTDSRVQMLLIRLLEMEMKPRMAGQVDEPVTSDIKRLIRMPHTLHGKTGLMVMPVPLDELKDFRPLRDAFPPLFPDDSVCVEPRERIRIDLKGERISLDTTGEVPTFAAVFLLCRKMASLVPGYDIHGLTN